MNTEDIQRYAETSYMLSVSNRTDEETRDSLNEFMEGHQTIDITTNEDTDDARQMVESGVNQSNPMVVVHKYDQMDEDMRMLLAQYLKGVAEKHTTLPIIVFDEEGANLGMANPDLRGRIRSL